MTSLPQLCPYRILFIGHRLISVVSMKLLIVVLLTVFATFFLDSERSDEMYLFYNNVYIFMHVFHRH